MWQQFDWKRVALAGLAGTAAMTALMLMAPLMGLPPMNIGKMLASVMGGVVALGWTAHLMIGVVLAIVYAALFARRLPGAPIARGAVYSLLPWLFAQLFVMPMMGAGLFSGSALLAGASLMGHLVYGAVVGAVYGGAPELEQAASRSQHAQT
jgi:uncharacterized membrane protein YagU involved in acid resistance